MEEQKNQNNIADINNKIVYDKNRNSYGAVNQNKQQYVLDSDLLVDDYV